VTEIVGSAYDVNALTVLTNQPSLAWGGSNTVEGLPAGSINLTQLSQSEFRYAYDVRSNNNAFAFAIINNGQFVDDVFQGDFLVFPDCRIILAAQGGAGQKVKIIIRDQYQLPATFILELQPYFQNYTLMLSAPNAPTGFSYRKVADITFMQDWNIGSILHTGNVTVKTQGLKYVP